MIKFLSRTKKFKLPKAFLTYLNHYKYVFNPSYYEHRNYKYLAIRCSNGKSEGVISYLLIYKSNDDITIYNLNKYYNATTNYVADPKIFFAGEKLYFTFNNGYISNGANSIFLAELKFNKIISTKECIYKNRKRIEKNWAFINYKNKLHVIYSISPFVLLKTNKISELVIEFEDDFTINNNIGKLSMGTPALEFTKNNYLLIAHRKIKIKNKRIYFGIPIFINLNNRKIKNFKYKILIHSIKNTLFSGYLFNPNLYSCTYFSGIFYKKDDLILCYGINDNNFNIIKLDKNILK